MKCISALALISLTFFAFGCEEEKAPEPEVEAALPEAPKPKEKTAEEKAAEEAAAKLAEEEEKKKAEVEKKNAELAKNPMTECCRALSAKGFTLRSPEYMTASKSCGEAMGAEKELSAALPAIKKDLGDKPLPEECSK